MIRASPRFLKWQYYFLNENLNRVKNENTKFIVVLGINLVTVCMLTLVNSRLSQWGIFLYLPGLFFFLSCMFLESKRGVIICLLTGCFLDIILNTPFGFHGLSLTLFHTLGKEWLRGSGNYKLWRSVIFQLCTNTLLGIVWFLWLFSSNQLEMRWPFSRFCSDIFLSSIFIIPLGFWLSQVAGQLMTPITNHSFKAESQL